MTLIEHSLIVLGINFPWDIATNLPKAIKKNNNNKVFFETVLRIGFQPWLQDLYYREPINNNKNNNLLPRAYYREPINNNKNNFKT